MDKKEPIYAKGVYVKNPFPDLFSISIKLEDFIVWAEQYKSAEGYVNLNIRHSKSDFSKWYCHLNDWKPEKKTESEEIPF